MEYINFLQVSSVSLSSDSHQVQTIVVDIQEKSLHETDILSLLANKCICTVCLSQNYLLSSLFLFLFAFLIYTLFLNVFLKNLFILLHPVSYKPAHCSSRQHSWKLIAIVCHLCDGIDHTI